MKHTFHDRRTYKIRLSYLNIIAELTTHRLAYVDTKTHIHIALGYMGLYPVRLI